MVIVITILMSMMAGDWMLVPAARNLHWRYEVLHSAFMTCKQKVAPGASLQENLDELLTAVRKIWEAISKNTVTINGQKKNMNGNIGMLFGGDGVTLAEKTVLRSYLNTTSNIAGCQAIRRKIGQHPALIIPPPLPPVTLLQYIVFKKERAGLDRKGRGWG